MIHMDISFDSPDYQHTQQQAYWDSITIDDIKDTHPMWTNTHGDTILHFACHHKADIKILKYLIDKGCDMNARNAYESTPLLCLAYDDYDVDVEKYVLLLDNGADVMAVDCNDRNALILATSAECPELVKLFVDSGVDIDYMCDGGTALYWACLKEADAEFIEALLICGANPNMYCEDTTPLHLSCFFGDIEAINILVKYGADITIQNKYDGKTPLDEFPPYEDWRIESTSLDAYYHTKSLLIP